jgi:uncharacterized cupin superfamily protein
MKDVKSASCQYGSWLRRVCIAIGNLPSDGFHGLTGAEISVNNLPAGAGVPFVHYHKKNEEIYIILSGKRTAVLDGETVEFAAGDVLKIAPAVKRQFSAVSLSRGHSRPIFSAETG